MTSPILVAVFTIVYLAVTVWLCRGLKLNARNLAMGGLACALTLILGSIMIHLPTGASITCGSWIPLMLLAVVCDKRLAFVNEAEDSTRRYYLKRYGLLDEEIQPLPLRPENRAYVDYMLNAAKNADDAVDCMMACLPCMLSYGWIFGEMLKNVPTVQNTPYARFVNDYAGERYESICKAWEAFTEKVCAGVSPEREAHCLEIFRTCSEHEHHFWEMAARPRTDLKGGVQA